eukprot:470925_1
MTLSNTYGVFIVLGCLLRSVFSGAYEINMNGQTIQVNVLNPDGTLANDRREFTDDYGQLLNRQKGALCSSLRDDPCQEVTINGAKTHNLFNYFPNHADESVVAYANSKYNKDPSPYLMKQPMNDRSINYLSRQNPHSLDTKTFKTRGQGLRQTLLDPGLAQTLFDPLQLVGSKTIKHKKKKKKKPTSPTGDKTTVEDESNTKAKQEDGTVESTDNEQEYDDIEIELYSMGQDGELANVLGLDDAEIGDTVDRIVAQLVASYLDNDSEEVDVSQIFANEMRVENGDVSMQELVLDERSMEQINELLNTISEKKQLEGGNTQTNEEIDGNQHSEAQVFALKFVIGSEEGDEQESQQENDDTNAIDNETLP